MASSDLDTATVILLALGAIIVLPLLVMGTGFGGTMGYGGMMGQGGMMGGSGTGGWWPLVGTVVQLVVLLALLGGGYLLFRRVTESQSSQRPAMEELRLAYARGELSDEEFEARREALERSAEPDHDRDPGVAGSNTSRN